MAKPTKPTTTKTRPPGWRKPGVVQKGKAAGPSAKQLDRLADRVLQPLTPKADRLMARLRKKLTAPLAADPPRDDYWQADTFLE